MSLFQNSVVKKHIATLPKQKLEMAWTAFVAHFHNPTIQENIRNSKEEQYQEGFLSDLFVTVFGYIKNPAPNFQLTTELKNIKNAKKTDGAILKNGSAIAVIELKGTDTTDLSKVEAQAFGYKNNQPNCVYVITSNFEKLRFYIDNAVDFEEFNLFLLTRERFELLWLCVSADTLLKNIPQKIKEESLTQEETITKKLYKDYSLFRQDIFQSIQKLNPQYDKLTLFNKTQKLLDRFLFVFFAEDRLLLAPNSVRTINSQWKELREKYDEYFPLYDRFKKYFGYLNLGKKDEIHDIFAYNGGLFAPDEILDSIKIDDAILYRHTLKISLYDFDSEVSVNVLGHIFEHSLNEIEEIQSELEGKTIEKTKTRRKKDGVFYTPKYITKYIVDTTIGKLCQEKKNEIEIIEQEYEKDRKGRKKETLKKLNDQLKTYRNWLLELTICDPACGSGAFLNQALEFLIAEHTYIDELQAKLLDSTFVFPNIENQILEKNLFGVDINEESVEIAKLSLWLRTARKGRKLTTLNDNIKCGNSLIDNAEIAGEKAFDWQKEFPQIFQKGGFDVIIGNPPYGAKLDLEHIKYFRDNYSTVIGHSEAYYLFIEKSLNELVRQNGKMSFIVPNAWMSNKYATELRNLILDWNLDILINFQQKNIFSDANVETLIFTLTKSKFIETNQVYVGVNIDELYLYEQNKWNKHEKKILYFSENVVINDIIEKMNKAEFTLKEKLDISNGIKPYQVGYGKNLQGIPLSTDDVQQKIYHSSIKIDESYKNEVKGKEVNRYHLKPSQSYIKWGSWLMSSKSIHYFEQPKILLRQIISGYLLATLDKDRNYADQSLYICTNFLNSDEEESLEFYLALLSSKLYGFYFRKFYSEEDNLFPKIKVNELKNLPIPKISKESQQPFIDLANKMLLLNESFSTKKDIFLGRIKQIFELDKLSKNLDNFYHLSFKDFVKELAKKKIVLSLSQQDEWQSYFEGYKKDVLSLHNEIQSTDNQIDNLVFELYGLTQEEIKIVKGIDVYSVSQN